MDAHFSDTICAPASGTGGAVALIRISGPDTFALLDRVVHFRSGKAASAKGNGIKFGEIPGVDEVQLIKVQK